MIQSGLMVKPQQLHVDPLQRGLDIDGVHYPCTEEGAQQLTEALNTRYAPAPSGEAPHMIEVRENPASPTGYDLHFTMLQGGVRVPVKGHLSQAKLDVLQDPVRCGLLKPGVLLRLSPPFLLIRRRRPDGGEESMPGLGDLNYLRTSAAQLQDLLNHSALARSGSTSEPAAPVVSTSSKRLIEICVSRNPRNPLQLWIETVDDTGRREGKAFTHHNIADLRQRHLFQDGYDVSLSLDHHTLGILNTHDRQEEVFKLSTESSTDDLQAVSARLTAILKR
jgi:hypothetical protein